MVSMRSIPAGALALALLVAAGCGSSPASRFYVLAPTVETQATSFSGTVGLGPVALPPYVDRDAVVTRESAHTLSLADFDRWAEPLQDAVERVLLQDLGAALGTAHVEPHPWGGAHVDVRVPVRILRFDADAAGSAHVVARWSVLDPDHGVLVEARTTAVEVPAPEPGVSGAAAALSAALGRLAEDIAAAVRGVPPDVPDPAAGDDF